jgi:hypothetical protein
LGQPAPQRHQRTKHPLTVFVALIFQHTQHIFAGENATERKTRLFTTTEVAKQVMLKLERDLIKYGYFVCGSSASNPASGSRVFHAVTAITTTYCMTLSTRSQG